jgi:hypothetical protein
MRDGWIWERLGIEATVDVGEIRRAYAARLKAIDTESEADAFIALRHARDEALALAAAGPDSPHDFDFEDEWLEPDFDGASLDSVPDALPEAAAEKRDRIDALLFAGAEPEDEGELERLTRALLDDSPDHIEAARWLESWVVDRIVQAMPRSDPMIEPAIAHFRWDKGSELSRPPAIDYILQRRDDRFFEIDLATNARDYALILESLREPPDSVGGRRGRWHAPRVEYLLSYLQTYRPTVIRGLDEENVRLWSDRIEAERHSGGVGHWLRERRRNLVWNRGLHAAEAERVDTSSLAGGGWLIFMAIFAASRLLTWNSAPATPPSVVDARPQAILYQDSKADLDPFVARATLGQGDLAALEKSNPRLHAQLMEKWRQARRNQEDRRWFDQGVEDLLETGFSDAIRSGGYALQAEHWRLFADRLKSARRISPDLCGALLRGDPDSLPFSADLSMRSKALVAKALLAPAGRPVERSPPGSTFRIPGPIAESTAARSRLDDETLSRALRDRGTPAQRCDARIALIESALDQPRRVAAPLFRDMSAGL